MATHMSLPHAGIDIDAESTDLVFELGTIVQSSGGSEYIYVEADEAITQYALCFIASDYGISMLNTAGSGTTPNAVCIPQIAVTSGSYAWALIRGNGSVLAAASAAANNKLYTTATDGVVDDASTGHDLVQGLVLTASNGATQAATAVFASTRCGTNWQD